jgi:hypothetical protein
MGFYPAIRSFMLFTSGDNQATQSDVNGNKNITKIFSVFIFESPKLEALKFINLVISTLLSADSNRSFSSSLCSVAAA